MVVDYLTTHIASITATSIVPGVAKPPAGVGMGVRGLVCCCWRGGLQQRHRSAPAPAAARCCGGSGVTNCSDSTAKSCGFECELVAAAALSARANLGVTTVVRDGGTPSAADVAVSALVDAVARAASRATS